MSRTYAHTSQLPAEIPVFPLPGALVLPRTVLPLNIFEPRYLAMIDTALAGSRLIGMIQPRSGEEDAQSPALADIGCAGRLTALQETDDGRYLIQLTGVCRFRVAQEIATDTPFRMVRADWEPFAHDLEVPSGAEEDRKELFAALKGYLDASGFGVDWESVETAPLPALINSLSAGCPFTNAEKQALLEAPTLHDRTRALIALLVMERPGQSGGGYVQ